MDGEILEKRNRIKEINLTLFIIHEYETSFNHSYPIDTIEPINLVLNKLDVLISEENNLCAERQIQINKIVGYINNLIAYVKKQSILMENIRETERYDVKEVDKELNIEKQISLKSREEDNLGENGIETKKKYFIKNNDKDTFDYNRKGEDIFINNDAVDKNAKTSNIDSVIEYAKNFFDDHLQLKDSYFYNKQGNVIEIRRYNDGKIKAVEYPGIHRKIEFFYQEHHEKPYKVVYHKWDKEWKIKLYSNGVLTKIIEMLFGEKYWKIEYEFDNYKRIIKAVAKNRKEEIVRLLSCSYEKNEGVITDKKGNIEKEFTMNEDGTIRCELVYLDNILKREKVYSSTAKVLLSDLIIN